jgi:hypothetical protein
MKKYFAQLISCLLIGFTSSFAFAYNGASPGSITLINQTPLILNVSVNQGSIHSIRSYSRNSSANGESNFSSITLPRSPAPYGEPGKFGTQNTILISAQNFQHSLMRLSIPNNIPLTNNLMVNIEYPINSGAGSAIQGVITGQQDSDFRLSPLMNAY